MAQILGYFVRVRRASSGSVEHAPAEHPTLEATPKKQKQISQEHHYLHNYGPAYLWEVICSKTAPMETKLSAMALFLYQLGMRWLAEKNSGSGYVPVQALQCIA